MSDKIKFPPLPKFPLHMRETLRARDLEVARVALEAAAMSIRGRGHGSWDYSQIIRAL